MTQRPKPPPNGGVNVGAPAGGIPDWLVIAIGAILVGGIAEMIYSADRKAGYTFTLIVLLGFLAQHNRLPDIVDTLRKIGVVSR